MKRHCIVMGLLFLSAAGFAQTPEKQTDYLDVSAGLASYRGSFGFSYFHAWQFGEKRKIGVGIGGRFTSFVGANIYYITAPAELTSESTSPLVIFKENVIENIDSLLVKAPQVNSANLFITIAYQVSKKVTVGFNIDAIGFSFGGNKRGNYINGIEGKNTNGIPTAFNVLLISDNDRGSLNSELYGRYFVKDRWAVKVAAQFLFTEYTTETPVQLLPKENDRFRNKSLLFCLGVIYKL